ncbi:putative membrane protein [Sporosarcina luteola]|nr:putative membrane protein [Sporosarcina luteola]
MKWMKWIPFVACFLLWMPIQAQAVDYSIKGGTIDAYLKENGNVDIVERYQYDFDGKFNGITRGIVTKPGTSIDLFRAFENEKALKVEKENQLYKIHRKGKDENILVELQYTIVNGVENYKDGAQFFWAFFDENNESSYDEMTIRVHPPNPEKPIDYLGYGQAHGTGLIQQDGSVLFGLGEVPSETAADVRIIYPSTLFPQVQEVQGSGLSKLQKDRQEFIRKAERREQMKPVLSAALIGLSAILAFIGFGANRKRRAQYRNAKEQLVGKEVKIPDDRISIPAAIFFTQEADLKPEAMSAALLDLVRKGYVRQVSDERFELISPDADLPHEQRLIQLLFNQIGDGKLFTADMLKKYMEQDKHIEAYSAEKALWVQEIKNEVNQAVYANRGAFRSGLWLLALGYLGLSVLSIVYELYLFLIGTIILMFAAALFAAFYKPRSVEGHKIAIQWERFITNFDFTEWQAFPPEDKIRSYLYGIGIGDATLTTKGNPFATADEAANHQRTDSAVLYNPLFMTTSFTQANETATAHLSSSSSSSTSSSSGSGGGSGAF